MPTRSRSLLASGLVAVLVLVAACSMPGAAGPPGGGVGTSPQAVPPATAPGGGALPAGSSSVPMPTRAASASAEGASVASLGAPSSSIATADPIGSLESSGSSSRSMLCTSFRAY